MQTIIRKPSTHKNSLMHSLVFYFSKACQMQNTFFFFLLFVLVRQQFYKIVPLSFRYIFRMLYPTLCNQLLIFPTEILLRVWATLTGLQRKVEKTFRVLTISSFGLQPRHVREFSILFLRSGMGKLLRNYRLLIVNKRSRQEKTRHFCQGNITRLWVLAGNRGA